MQTREIVRNPEPPDFSEEQIGLLTKLLFRPDDPAQPVDLIFEFSSPNGVSPIARLVVGLLQKEISKKVFLTGGMPNFSADSFKAYKPESDLVAEEIHTSNFPQVQFFRESASTSILENVTEALKVLDFREYEKVLFISKKHDSKRAYLSLRKFLPHTTLIKQTFAQEYPEMDRPLDENSWHLFPLGRARVWGEFLRIQKYGQRGDIAYDEETASAVSRIESSIEAPF